MTQKVVKPIALDESFRTTEQNPQNIADVLANKLDAIKSAIENGGSGEMEAAFECHYNVTSATDIYNAMQDKKVPFFYQNGVVAQLWKVETNKYTFRTTSTRVVEGENILDIVDYIVNGSVWSTATKTISGGSSSQQAYLAKVESSVNFDTTGLSGMQSIISVNDVPTDGVYQLSIFMCITPKTASATKSDLVFQFTGTSGTGMPNTTFHAVVDDSQTFAQQLSFSTTLNLKAGTNSLKMACGGLNTEYLVFVDDLTLAQLVNGVYHNGDTFEEVNDLTEAIDFNADDELLVVSPNSTRKMLWTTLANKVLGFIKSLSTTITAFRSGDVIPVDGPSGTAKMSKDDLLAVTSENVFNTTEPELIGNFCDGVISRKYKFARGAIGLNGYIDPSTTRVCTTNVVEDVLVALPVGYVVHAVAYYSSYTDATHFTLDSFVSVGRRICRLHKNNCVLKFSIRKDDSATLELNEFFDLCSDNSLISDDVIKVVPKRFIERVLRDDIVLSNQAISNTGNISANTKRLMTNGTLTEKMLVIAPDGYIVQNVAYYDYFISGQDFQLNTFVEVSSKYVNVGIDGLVYKVSFRKTDNSDITLSDFKTACERSLNDLDSFTSGIKLLSTPLFTYGYIVDSATGNLVSIGNGHYTTAEIPSGATKVVLQMIKTGSTNGFAWLDADGNYISGEKNTSEVSGTWIEYNIPANAAYIKYGYNTFKFQYFLFVGSFVYDKFIYDKKTPVTIFVAAQDASDFEKLNADYTCDGVNDEKEINAALDAVAPYGGTVTLSSGIFHIDSWTYTDVAGKYCIKVPSKNTYVKLVGAGIPQYWYTRGGTRLLLSDTLYDAMTGTEAEYTHCIVRGEAVTSTVSSKNNFEISNLAIQLKGNQKPIICIDALYSNRICVEKVSMWAMDINDQSVTMATPPSVAVGGCVGLRSCGGSNQSSVTDFKNVRAEAFYEGFKVGAEHAIFWNCVAQYCVYGYTFGNFVWTNAWTHPVTIINCCDERNVNLPLFVNSTGSPIAIDFINFNIERVATATPGGVLGDLAKETNKGKFCGRLEYTIQSDYGSSINQKNIAFWESDGSGIAYESVNQAHRLIGSTSERSEYAANFGQKYYDTDLNKLLIYTGSAWVDSSGNLV